MIRQLRTLAEDGHAVSDPSCNQCLVCQRILLVRRADHERETFAVCVHARVPEHPLHTPPEHSQHGVRRNPMIVPEVNAQDRRHCRRRNLPKVEIRMARTPAADARHSSRAPQESRLTRRQQHRPSSGRGRPSPPPQLSQPHRPRSARRRRARVCRTPQDQPAAPRARPWESRAPRRCGGRGTPRAVSARTPGRRPPLASHS